MKSTVYSLNKSGIEEDFFERSRMIALQSSYPGYTVCAHLNTRLGLCFEREPELDILIEFSNRKNKPRSLSLFEEATGEPLPKVCFPVFRHLYPVYEDTRILLYTNRADGMTLLADLKWADYILLLQGETYDDISRGIPELFSRTEKIALYKELDISSVKQKGNLII